MIDNSNLRQKILVREKGLSLINNINSVVDMYAGEGHISRSLWSKYNCDLVCIEKESEKINKIDFDCEKINDDNENHLELALIADVVDMDAYGLVFNKIKKIAGKSKKDQIIFFTEANPLSKKLETTVKNILKLNPTCFWVEKAQNTTVYYGFLFYKGDKNEVQIFKDKGIS